jgi:hypothetical protein
MSNLFAAIGAKLRSQRSVVFLWLLFLTMAVIGVLLMYEDYGTNLAGYQMLPTRHLNDWIVYVVALIPQVGQLGFGYGYMHDTHQRWMGILALVLHLVDVTTSTLYKTPDFTPGMLALTILESEIIYAIGAHLMSIVGIGMVLELAPDAWSQVSQLLWPNGP